MCSSISPLNLRAALRLCVMASTLIDKQLLHVIIQGHEPHKHCHNLGIRDGHHGTGVHISLCASCAFSRPFILSCPANRTAHCCIFPQLSAQFRSFPHNSTKSTFPLPSHMPMQEELVIKQLACNRCAQKPHH